MLWTALVRPRPGAHLRARHPLQPRRRAGRRRRRRPTSTAPPSAGPATTSPSSPTAARWPRRSRPPSVLAGDGIDAEVIDLRTLRPLDTDTILGSVARTHRAVIVDEGWRSGSLSAEISARITEGAFYDLDAPVARVCSAEVPMPYAKHLEEAALPQVRRHRRRRPRRARGRLTMGEFRMPSLGADMDAGTIVEWRVAARRRPCTAATSSPSSRPRSPTSRSRSSRTASSRSCSSSRAARCPVGTVARPHRRRTPTRQPPAPPAPPSRAAAEPGAAPSRPRRSPSRRPRPSRSPADSRGPLRPRLAPGPPAGRRRAASTSASVAGTGPERRGRSRRRRRRPAGAVDPGRRRAGHRGRAGRTTTGADRAADRQAAMRHAIGELMARSKREIPHYYLATTIDLGAGPRLAGRRQRRPAGHRAHAARRPAAARRPPWPPARCPAVNGFWRRRLPAVARGAPRRGGLAARRRPGRAGHPRRRPARRSTSSWQALRDLVQRARAGGLRSSEMSDPTITVTNLGDQGVEEVFGVIYPPQVALVGFGKIVERPWAVDRACSASARSCGPPSPPTTGSSDGHDGAALPRRHRPPAPAPGGTVNRDDALDLLARLLHRIAPEVDPSDLVPRRAAPGRASTSTRWTSSTS